MIRRQSRLLSRCGRCGRRGKFRNHPEKIKKPSTQQIIINQTPWPGFLLEAHGSVACIKSFQGMFPSQVDIIMKCVLGRTRFRSMWSTFHIIGKWLLYRQFYSCLNINISAMEHVMTPMPHDNAMIVNPIDTYLRLLSPENTDWYNLSSTTSFLNHCGLVTPYGDRDLSQHWLG